MMIRFFVIMALIIVGDQLTKLWILQNFALYDSTVIIPGLFNLTFLRNTGAAFGMFAGQPALFRQIFFITMAVVALVVIVLMQRKLGRQNMWYTISLAFISGGAVGNLIDRIAYGSVIDFLDVYIASHHWPAFNVADSGITVGVGIFLVTQFREDMRAKQKPAVKE